MGIIQKEMAIFFGENPRKFDVVAINMVTLLIGVALAYLVPAIRESTTMLQKMLIILIAWDDLGGVVANFTKSTNDYHAGSRRNRLVFYSLHILQPAILFYFFDTSLTFFLFVWLYPVLSAFAVSDLVSEEKRNTLAGLLWLVGIILLIYVIPVPTVLAWFGITFFTKLILGYAINHFSTLKA